MTSKVPRALGWPAQGRPLCGKRPGGAVCLDSIAWPASIHLQNSSNLSPATAAHPGALPHCASKSIRSQERDSHPNKDARYGCSLQSMAVVSQKKACTGLLKQCSKIRVVHSGQRATPSQRDGAVNPGLAGRFGHPGRWAGHSGLWACPLCWRHTVRAAVWRLVHLPWTSSASD